jgi:hypothetical protein
MDIPAAAWLIPAVLVLVGVGLIYFGWRNKRLAAASKTWPSVAGKIVSSCVTEHESGDAGNSRTTYKAEVEYDFAVEGKPQRGKRVRFGGRIGGSQNQALEIVRRYPVGTAVSVFYDPAKPSQCTLEQSASGSNLLIFLGVFFLLLTTLVMVVVVAFQS